MDSDVNALDYLLTSLEQINAETMQQDAPSSSAHKSSRDTALLEKKGLGVKVVAGEPNLFGVRLRKVNAAELAPSAAHHASITGEAPLATQVNTYSAPAALKVSAPAPRHVSPLHKPALKPSAIPAFGKPPPPPTLRGADGRDEVDRYLDSLSEQLDKPDDRGTRGTRKFVDNSDAIGSELASGEDLAFGLPPPPRPFTIPPIPASELKRQLAELPLGRGQQGAPVPAGVHAGVLSAFPPGVDPALVSHVPPRPAWSALHADLTYTPNTGTVGVYGITYRGTWQPADGASHKVAVKRFKHHNLDAAFVALFAEEVPHLLALNHPNILPLLGVCLQDFNFSLFQWHEGGTLATFLERTPRPSAETALRIAKGIADGVEELHECGVVHGSLRPTNIMLDSQQNVRLADYGFEYVKTEVRRTGQTMGCEYNAPEQLEHGPAYGTADAVDVFSIAIIINQLWAGVPPFVGLLPRVIVAGVAQSAMRPQLAPTLPSPLRRTVQAAWAQQPARRPTFSTVASILSSPPSKLLA